MINYNDVYYVYNNTSNYSTTSANSLNETGIRSTWYFYESTKTVTYVPYSVTSVKKGKGAKLR